MRAVLLSCLLLVACNKKHEQIEGASPDWDGDRRAVGACMGTAATGASVPEGQDSVCYEKQTEDECTSRMSYLYVEHATCASRGFKETCPKYETNARFQGCGVALGILVSPGMLDAAKEVVGIYDQAKAASDEAAGDCASLGIKLSSLRTRLEEIGKEYPGVLKQMSAEKLQELDAIAKQEALSSLRACKDPEVLQFTYAMTKVM